MSAFLPGEVFDANLKLISAESDRGAVLVAAAMLDAALATAITSRLLASGVQRDPLFEVPNAPLSSFSAKIEVAFRLGVIVDGMAKALHVFRKLRNEFAHTPEVCTFSDSRVMHRVESLLRRNPMILAFVAGRPSESLRFCDTSHDLADPTIREVFDLYYAYVSMKLAESACQLKRLRFYKTEGEPGATDNPGDAQRLR